MKNLKQKIIDKSFNFEENNGTFKKSTIFLTDLFKILEKEQLILPIVSVPLVCDVCYKSTDNKKDEYDNIYCDVCEKL